LANHSGRDHTTISRQLAVLEEAGLVERRTDPQDRRVRVAALTTSGLRVTKQLNAARRRLLGRLLADWTTTEQRSFARLARKMKDGMLRARQDAD
jgi:DNA-binding MarR family transcriptional regulator